MSTTWRHWSRSGRKQVQFQRFSWLKVCHQMHKCFLGVSSKHLCKTIRKLVFMGDFLNTHTIHDGADSLWLCWQFVMVVLTVRDGGADSSWQWCWQFVTVALTVCDSGADSLWWWRRQFVTVVLTVHDGAVFDPIQAFCVMITEVSTLNLNISYLQVCVI